MYSCYLSLLSKMTFSKKVKAISLLAASSITFLTGNSLKANEEFPTGMYGIINIGAGEVSSYDDPAGTDMEFDYGFAYELGIGYDFGKNFRTDISYVGGKTGFDGTVLGIDDGDFEMKAFMLTGYLDFPIENTKWEPFIGIGVGSMEIDTSDACTTAANTDCSADVFTYSLSGGVNYALNSNTSISAKITYMNPQDFDVTNQGLLIEDIEVSTLSAYTGLNFKF